MDAGPTSRLFTSVARAAIIVAVTHDPKRAIETLREQLASHDKPIGFLFGSGTSTAIRVGKPGAEEPLIPGIAGLTSLCMEAVATLGDGYDAAIKVIAEQSTPDDRPVNIEDILSTVRRMADVVGVAKLAGLTKDELRKVETTIQSTIATNVHPDEKVIPLDIPQARFARWVKAIPRQLPVEVFTTNYDILLERALEDEMVSLFDGFVGSYLPFFEPASMDRGSAAPGNAWTRLWKIHGSVSWRWEERPGGRRIVRGAPTESGELILPSHLKYDESRRQPYLAMLDHLRTVLDRENTCFVVAGYSFGDQHINGVIFETLARRPSTHLFALMHSDPGKDDVLTRVALQNANLLVLGAKRAVIAGEEADWRLVEPVETATSRLIDYAFDSDAVPEGDELPLTGRMRLGDFSWFSRFLESLTRG